MLPRAVQTSWLSFIIGLHCLGSARGEIMPENTIFPGAEWQHTTPENQGLSAPKLQSAIRYLKQHSGDDGVSELIVVRNGYVIWQGDQVTKVHGIWSGTKSFTSTCLGLLIDDGKCSLNTRAMEFLPEMSAHFPEITLRQFTTMTSGYRALGDAPRGSYTHGPSQTPFTPAPSPLFAPGTHYAYWDSAMNQFGNALTHIAGQALEDLFAARIAGPIGMNESRWRWGAFESPTGDRINGGAGNNGKNVFISATELARLGWLFLNHGRWEQRQLISSNWVHQATSIQVPATVPPGHQASGIAGAGAYGFNWWRNGRLADGTHKWPGAPESTYAASGYNNNDLFVIPDWNMVIVRLGLDEQNHKITDLEYGHFIRQVGDAITDTTISGHSAKWHPITLTFRGPQAAETDSSPNPFLDYRQQVEFTSPSGQTFNVPGYFNGDGRGGSGPLWQVRFSPDQAGRWTYRASFRRGKNIAISLNSAEGHPLAFDGEKGAFKIAETDSSAPGFRKWGRLEYVGSHYLKFRDGPYWLRGGTDSPENILAYAGFDNTLPSHRFLAHENDWTPGDPDWNQGQGRALIGAINSLSSQGANSLYALLMNIGGDGGDVFPWIGSPTASPDDDNLHFDLSKLQQWETVFRHAQDSGIFLHFVLNEAERANKAELDQGELGTERRLFYREMIARFGHHLALEWNLCEEYNLQLDFGPDRIRAFADYIRAIDPYDHPITVHSAGDPMEKLAFTFGDPRFSLTSVQLNHRRIDTLVEALRKATRVAGRPLPISMDEFTLDIGQDKSWIPYDRPDLHRKTKLWPTYLSGGMIEFILEGLLDVESFKTPERAALWRDIAHAQDFMQSYLPFWVMEPADHRVTGEATLRVGKGQGQSFQLGAQVFEQRGVISAIYFPIATQVGRMDLSPFRGRLELRWFNPRTGRFVGTPSPLAGGYIQALPPVPESPEEDWVALIRPH